MENPTYFATAPKGMPDLLVAELESLGATNVLETRAGAQFEGSMEVVYRACLWSRLANRILLPLKTFSADSPEALYKGVREIDWSAHLGVNQTLAVDANVSSSKITHSHYAALKIKDAIVDGFAVLHGLRRKVRVNTISQSPTDTTAGSGVAGFDGFYRFANDLSPLGNASADECADYCISLFSDYTRKVTMQNLFHDGGFSFTGMSETAMNMYLKVMEDEKKGL